MNYSRNDLVFNDTKRPMQLDIFIPAHNLGFEFNGKQHYTHHYLFGAVNAQQKRDKEKQQVCTAKGITLIIIPYWWDMQQGSLLATLHKCRPDIVPAQDTSVTMIPLESPLNTTGNQIDMSDLTNQAMKDLVQSEKWDVMS